MLLGVHWVEFFWEGLWGMGVVFVLVLCGWEYLCYEVIEDVGFGIDGGCWMYMFDLGIYFF